MFEFTVILIVAIFLILKIFIVVPEKYVFLVERLGVFKGAYGAGLHILIPFLDQIKHRQNLKEIAVDIPPQSCITKDNVSINVDGILYIRVLEPYKASYEIDNFMFSTIQLAQTTLRSEIGKIILDRTFSEREEIHAKVVAQLDEATTLWGVKVTRYEIKNITPPKQILHEMELQVKAEREKRAEITVSEGDRTARVNRSEGERQEAINFSEGEKVKRINEAEGKAREIELISSAKAKGISLISEAISQVNGQKAVDFQVLEDYLIGMGTILNQSKVTVLPTSMANISSFFEGFSKLTQKVPNLENNKKEEN